VPLRHQVQLFEAIPGARAFRIDAGHDAIVARPRRAVPILVEACHAAIGAGPRNAPADTIPS
jgi:hypothetical protein